MVGGKVKASGFAGDDPWQSQCELTSIDGSLVGTVRPVKKGDEVLLTRFGREGLSAESRGKFECYKWMSGELTQELQAAIELSLERRDLHLVALDDASKAIGYFRRADMPQTCRGDAAATTWISRGDEARRRRGWHVNVRSRPWRAPRYVFLWAASDAIPELGLAVADAWQGRGLGPALLKLVAAMGQTVGRQALELTTMKLNTRALSVYPRGRAEIVFSAVAAAAATPPPQKTSTG